VSKVKAKRLGLRCDSNPFPSIKFLRSFRLADLNEAALRQTLSRA
jgi:hypothetical protein